MKAAADTDGPRVPAGAPGGPSKAASAEHDEDALPASLRVVEDDGSVFGDAAGAILEGAAEEETAREENALDDAVAGDGFDDALDAVGAGDAEQSWLDAAGGTDDAALEEDDLAEAEGAGGGWIGALDAHAGLDDHDDGDLPEDEAEPGRAPGSGIRGDEEGPLDEDGETEGPGGDDPEPGRAAGPRRR